MAPNPVTRKDLLFGDCRILSRGRWGNADILICRRQETCWGVKDFWNCPALVRNTWGRWMVGREYRALKRLAGVGGVPGDVFRLDAFALGYRFIPGKTLRETVPNDLPADFFEKLEDLVRKIHRRRLVHLDIRNRGNILLTDTGGPALVDFQSSLDLLFIPGFLHPLLRDIDLSGVYKNWMRFFPGRIDSERTARFESIRRLRFMWVMKGYPMGTKRMRRK